MRKDRWKIAKKETIAHYKRMIAWASMEPSDDPVHIDKMSKEIGELWGVADCAYCKENKMARCSSCPVFVGCNSIHTKFKKAKNWAEWINIAIEIIKYVEKK